jgi:hypothetical protein
MKPLILTLCALALGSACWESRTRPERVDDPELAADLRLPDSSSYATSAPQLSRDSETVTKASRPKRTVPTPPAAEDTSPPQGYAPNLERDSTPPETMAADDTASARASTLDTISPRDTARPAPASRDTVASGDSGSDTVSPIEQAPPSVSPPTDQASASGADTTLTPSPDSMVGRDTVTRAAATPVAPSATATNRTLPVGTEIMVALNDSISSRRDTVGRRLSAHVMEKVTSPAGQTVIDAGAPVRLTLTKLEPAKNRKPSGKITFRVDGIEVGGRLQKISADVRPVQHELQGRGVTAEDAAKVGIGAAGGAVLGRVIGGNTRGAVVGGVVGAAGGAVVAHQTATRDVIVKAKTPLVFVLNEPLVTP